MGEVTSSDVLALAAQSALILLGILVSQVLILGAKFLPEYPADYIWDGLKRIALFASAIAMLELVIGKLVILPTLRHLLPLGAGAEIVFLTIAAGMVAAALPSGAEWLLSALLPLDQLNTAATKRAFRILVWLQIITHQQLGRSIQRLLQQDNIDFNFQREGPWNCGLTPTEAGRVTRIVYELYKREIAKERRNAKFLSYYKDIYPGHKFYLLAKHLGQKSVRDLLHHPPQVNWDGKERRHRECPGSPQRRTGDDRKSA